MKYNFNKLVDGPGAEKLNGYERVIHDKLKEKFTGLPVSGVLIPSSYFKFGDLSDNIEDTPTMVNRMLSTREALQNQPLFKKLGCTVYENLTGRLYCPNIDVDDAALKAEGEESPANTATAGGVILDPARYTITKTWSKEFVSVSSNFAAMLKIMYQAAERAVSRQVLKLAAAANVIADRDWDDVAAAITWADVVALYSDITPATDEAKFVLSKPLNGKLMGTPKAAGTAQFISDGAFMAGTRAIGTALVEYDSDLIYGDWSFCHVGIFEATEIIVNPYTVPGSVTVTMNLFGDVKIGLAGAFKSIRNGSTT